MPAFRVDGGMILDSGLKAADFVLATSWAVYIRQTNGHGLDPITETVLQVIHVKGDVACHGLRH